LITKNDIIYAYIIIYVGMFFGVFLEGEMIMISSVIAAHHGYLNFWLVAVLCVTGTYCSDCFYFFLGRKKGKEWLIKNQKITVKAEKIVKRLEKYPKIILLSYRFLYGFRSITPLVIGASKIKTSTFLLLGSIGTLVWGTVYCTIGYMFGELIKSELGHIEHVEKYIIAVLALAGILFIIVNRFVKKHRMAVI
jgi:membrane protein DedA with SNARE-associated domain